MLETELRHFIQNQPDLVARYQGKVLAIRGDEVVGVFPTALEAYLRMKERFALGTFLLQPCVPGPDAYTVTISSAELFIPPR